MSVAIAALLPLCVCENTPARVTGCGEFAVRILCNYFQIEFPEDKVLGILRPGASGETSLAQIRDCLEALDCECAIWRGDFEDLMSVTSPMVLFVKRRHQGIGHFGVVLREEDTGALVAYDPFASPDGVVIDRAALERSWTGVAMAVRYPRPHGLWLWYVLPGIGGIAVGVASAYTGKRFRQRRQEHPAPESCV
ncbi:MAG: cysteine peptidase family C39 domain-containing protein [Thermoguttaceae bacterium]|jgi:ABC-type bacteriocin/lantibiotic exporter with double-glycine peptidase domain|nr:cysteine peptidase family C39 domain-containing protein [Thermoguttaceae bacterium]